MENKEIKTEEKKKSYKVFRDYYKDPEFKQKHLNKMKEKIQCEICGTMISRSNMKTHNKSKKCQTFNEKNRLKKVEEMAEQIAIERLSKEKADEIFNKLLNY